MTVLYKILILNKEALYFLQKDKSQTDIHGAYCDEGRVTRVMASDPIWGTLAQRSIEHYREIENESGKGYYILPPTVILS